MFRFLKPNRGRYTRFAARHRRHLSELAREAVARASAADLPFARANLFELEGRLTDAISVLEPAARSSDPNVRAAALTQRARLMAAGGNYTRALAEYREAAIVASSHDIHAVLGEHDTLCALGRLEDAHAIAARLIDSLPRQTDQNVVVVSIENAIHTLVDALKKAGRTAEADAVGSAALAARPDIDL